MPAEVHRPASLVALLRDRQDQDPTGIAYRFLIDGETQESVITYRELDQQARRVAAQLRARGLGGERALLLYQPGLEYISAFFGCLYAGVVAVPAYPPRSMRHLPRLVAILSDAGARVALTTAAILDLAQPFFAQAPDFPQPVWIATDALAVGGEDDWRDPAATGQDLAFLQYTSGSTQSPRGVMLSHDNLLYNLGLMHQWFEDTTDNVVVSWLPPYHDMGLIGAILTPLYGGFPAVLMSPVHFLERPQRWLTAISTYRGTSSAAPNFAYDLCVRRIPEQDRAGWDLSSWRVAVNGAEPVRAATIARFQAAFAPSGLPVGTLRPCYGLAEATLLVSADPAGTPVHTRTVSREGLARGDVRASATGTGETTLVACGRALGVDRLRVVDPRTGAAVPSGQLGEIWLAGPGVAQGYWGRPEQSRELFDARPVDDPDTGYLRTEDLGFLDESGRLFVTGRIKDLIIIRGRNYYPHDIEAALQASLPRLRAGCGAAFTVAVEGEERLVVVQEVDRDPELDPASLANDCRRILREECEVDLSALLLIAPRTLPKTSSGKIQRRATRAAYLDGTLELVGAWQAPTARQAREPYTPPGNPVETLLVEIFTDLLGAARVGVHDNFFTLGGQSLLANELAVRVSAALPVSVSLADIFDAPTVAQLAALLARRSLTDDDALVVGLLAEFEAELDESDRSETGGPADRRDEVSQ